MRLFIILSVVCAFMFFSAGLVKADDISDLKEQLKALQEQTNVLNAKIQELESKQEAQAKEIKKVPDLAHEVSDLKEGSLGQITEGLSVGGHLKFYLADQTTGNRNNDEQHNNLSAGIHHAYLFFSKELSDNGLGNQRHK